MKMNRGNNFMNWPFGRAYLLIGLMLMILLPGAIVYADIIHLKNGNSVEGTVFEQTSDEIKVSMKYGVMSFSREEIASIEKEKPQSAVVPEQDQTQLSSPETSENKANKITTPAQPAPNSVLKTKKIQRTASLPPAKKTAKTPVAAKPLPKAPIEPDPNVSDNMPVASPVVVPIDTATGMNVSSGTVNTITNIPLNSNMLNRKKAVLFAGLFALIVMLAIPLILAAILSTISLGIVFKKAGQRWWYGLIPIYNIYVCFKIAGKPKWFKNLVITIIAYNLICLLISFLIPAGPIQSFINSAIQVAINAIVLITLLLVDIYLARKFGKSGAFGVGLYFLPFIFMAILAFGKSQYLGNQSPQAPQPPQPNVIS